MQVIFQMTISYDAALSTIMSRRMRDAQVHVRLRQPREVKLSEWPKLFASIDSWIARLHWLHRIIFAKGFGYSLR
jgi:hypothetical protein